MAEQAEPAPGGIARGRLATKAPTGAIVVGYGSLVPLALGLIAILIGGIGTLTKADFSNGFIAYASLLLTFFAGARFGHALRVTGTSVAAALTIAPVIVALVALYLPDQIAAGILAVAYAAQGAWDVWSADRAALAAWYGRLRLRTTPIAVLLLASGVFVFGVD